MLESSFPPLGPVVVVYASVAAGMVGFNLWVLLQFFPRKGGAPTLARAALVGFVLLSSLGLWLSILYDELTGDSSTGFTAALFGIQIMMMAPFVWAFVAILRGHERHVQPDGWAWPATLALVILGNELLMGAVFSIALGVVPWAHVGALELSVAAAGSVWFFWPMFANMFILLVWVPLPRAERAALLGLAASALVGPWVVSSAVVGLLLMASVMSVTFLAVFLEPGAPSRTGHLSVRTWKTLMAVAGAFALMFAGQVYLIEGPGGSAGALPYLLAMFVVMLAEAGLLARRLLMRSGANKGEDPETDNLARSLARALMLNPAKAPSSSSRPKGLALLADEASSERRAPRDLSSTGGRSAPSTERAGPAP